MSKYQSLRLYRQKSNRCLLLRIVVSLLLFFLHLFIVALVLFIGFFTFHKRLFASDFNYGSFLDVDYYFWNNEPDESTEFSFLIQSVFIIKAIFYPRSNFFHCFSINRESKLVSKFVNVRTDVIKDSFTLCLCWKSFFIIQAIFLCLEISVLIFSKTVKENFEISFFEL